MQHKYHRQGCVTMKQNVEDRAAMLGEYIVENKATVRRAAKQFGVSKSTVHKDMVERLPDLSMSLYESVEKILAENKAERHIRGGMATKAMYQRLTNCHSSNHSARN